MAQSGCELKVKHAALMREHGIRPLRAPIPLLPSTAGPQIIEGYAATSDLDAERMSFKGGSLSWPADLSKLPLLVRHDSNRIAGRILDLDHRPDGRLFIRARVDDPEARCMGGLSIAATVIECEARDENSMFFHFIIVKAVIDEISLTPIPANARAVVTSRRDVVPWDDRTAHDELKAAVGRAHERLQELQASWSAPLQPQAAVHIKSAATFAGCPAPPLIYGRLPAAVLQRERTPFRDLVARLPAGE